jgi:TolB-like protein/Flp pilus assembly protein TadD
MKQRKVKEPPPSVRVPARLRKVLLRGLSPAREDRYESMDGLLHELSSLTPAPHSIWRWSLGALLVVSALTATSVALWRTRDRAGLVKADALPSVRSIAVMPLENLTGDSGQEYFVDGMTEALITELSQIGALEVTARTSVLRYKAEKKSVPVIARELGVDAVVVGTVARQQNRVRIDAQLVHAASERNLWARSYDRELADVMTLQSEIAGAIATEVQAKLTPQDEARLSRTRPVKPAAYEAYLKGRSLVRRMSAEEANKAMKYFQQAIDIDPNYAQAYSGLADSYTTVAQFNGMPHGEAFPKAKAAAIRAIELDDSLAEAHRSLATILRRHDWDCAESEKQYQRALQLNPSDAETYAAYGVTLALSGRTDEAIAMTKRAVELDPLSPNSVVTVAMSYYFARQYDRAIEQAKKAVELDPTFIQGHRWLGLGYAAKGNFPDAIDEFKLTVKLSPANLTYLANLALHYAWAGKETEARQALAQVKDLSKTQFISAWAIGMIYVALGDKDEAFAWMDRAYEEHNGWLLTLRVNPWVDPLRSDPRFDEMVRRVEATTWNHSAGK